MQSTSSWDAIVIGAGPAGAVSAFLLGRQGLQVLLVESKRFPRTKVCGGCLNPRAITALTSLGLGDTLGGCCGESFDRIRLHHARKCAEVPLPSGMSITRTTFDSALVEAAIAAGAEFVSEAKCQVLPRVDRSSRTIRWSSTNGANFTATAPIVLACDGLGHPSLHELPEFESTIAPNSRIGLGTVIAQDGAADSLPHHCITMAVGNSGYVGLAHAENGRVSLAAAISPLVLSSGTSPTTVLQQILHSAGIDQTLIDAIEAVRGTPPITQRANAVAGERLFLVGDAAGYVEPFTGEGMAAAIEGASLAAPLAFEAARQWRPELADHWRRQYARSIRSRQLACRSIAWLVRHPQALRWSLAALAAQPRIGTTIGRWIGRSQIQQEQHTT